MKTTIVRYKLPTSRKRRMKETRATVIIDGYLDGLDDAAVAVKLEEKFPGASKSNIAEYKSAFNAVKGNLDADNTLSKLYAFVHKSDHSSKNDMAKQFATENKLDETGILRRIRSLLLVEKMIAFRSSKVPDPTTQLSTTDDFLKDYFGDVKFAVECVNLLLEYKNIILNGPPGTGKTFLAQKIVKMADNSDNPNVTITPFHPDFTYQEFVTSLRPKGDDFVWVDGIFLDIIKKCNDKPNEKYFLIIDEINRAVMTEVFGGLWTILEAGCRGEIRTLENKQNVSVPENLYIIGTMNDVDRSIRPLDDAARQRFAFMKTEPLFTSKWENYLVSLGMHSGDVRSIKNRMIELNQKISNTKELGPDFQIGHRYFIPQNWDATITVTEWFERIKKRNIIPQLENYPKNTGNLIEGF